jgi:hypothetical protein
VTDLPEPLWRGARIVVIALLIGVGINHLYWSLTDWNLVDMTVYWDAAQRLRAGGSLYADGANTFHAYRYAPWFAYAWVPLTYLPKTLVGFAWSAVLLAASAAVLWPLVRMRTTPALLLLVMMLPLLVPMASGGNVQPLMVAALLYGLPRRSGPLWVALAASLKVAPILFVLVYLGRREWTKAAVTGAIAVVLVAPALVMGLSPTTIDPGPVAALPAISPVLYIAVAGVVSLGALLVSAKWPTYGPIAAATATVIALPRLFLSDVTTLLAGLSGISGAPRPSHEALAQDAREPGHDEDERE